MLRFTRSHVKDKSIENNGEGCRLGTVWGSSYQRESSISKVKILWSQGVFPLAYESHSYLHLI